MWVIIVAVLLFLCLFSVLRFTICRICMGVYLQKICKQLGAKLRFRTALARFDRWGGAENSLYVCMEERVYSVRLIGFFGRKTRLRVYSSTQYSAANYSFPVVGWVLRTAKPEWKTKPKADFRAFLPKTDAEVIPCYLFHPCFLREIPISSGKEGAGIGICEGDKIESDGATVYTLPGLVRELKDRGGAS